ncbi:hypothetical protein FISHEDRAFT_72702 [Fistulina hepatica ATCC 64428]|nr:hypothetical protein FISHEDRAFT_72702 [Fistulina hepatica ATCC 64428]
MQSASPFYGCRWGYCRETFSSLSVLQAHYAHSHVQYVVKTKRVGAEWEHKSGLMRLLNEEAAERVRQENVTQESRTEQKSEPHEDIKLIRGEYHSSVPVPSSSLPSPPASSPSPRAPRENVGVEVINAPGYSSFTLAKPTCEVDPSTPRARRLFSALNREDSFESSPAPDSPTLDEQIHTINGHRNRYNMELSDFTTERGYHIDSAGPTNVRRATSNNSASYHCSRSQSSVEVRDSLTQNVHSEDENDHHDEPAGPNMRRVEVLKPKEAHNGEDIWSDQMTGPQGVGPPAHSRGRHSPLLSAQQDTVSATHSTADSSNNDAASSNSVMSPSTLAGPSRLALNVESSHSSRIAPEDSFRVDTSLHSAKRIVGVESQPPPYAHYTASFSQPQQVIVESQPICSHPYDGADANAIQSQPDTGISQLTSPSQQTQPVTEPLYVALTRPSFPNPPRQQWYGYIPSVLPLSQHSSSKEKKRRRVSDDMTKASPRTPELIVADGLSQESQSFQSEQRKRMRHALESDDEHSHKEEETQGGTPTLRDSDTQDLSEYHCAQKSEPSERTLAAISRPPYATQDMLADLQSQAPYSP